MATPAILSLNADLIMDTDARVRMTGQNRFRALNSMALVVTSSGQTLTNATETVVNFANEDFDTDTLHDNVTNNTRITIQLTGKYLLLFQLTYTGNATGERLIGFRVNGGGTVFVYRDDANGSGNNHTCSAFLFSSLTATNYIEVVAYQSSGGNLDLVSTGSYFGAVYLGE